MPEESANAANQQINTTQPTPLRGLVIRGVRAIKTINTVIKGEDGAEDRYMIVNEEDYDPEIHGEKVDKLPTRKKKAKKKSAKKKTEEE